ncbi:MAG: nif-specific transcriptional activator NifA [Desulfurivibrionaceae bacterium]|jgi:Nif-specific regulatory protein|nr:nif-specific transcriptional activator NifA [Pseudomonadota bacterium]MCG2822817.1 nif-specific transcriptional activator NifA [Desulfobulbaceae bacterium]MDP2002467.1 nif-specific transcriptional activator NifA [Desulfurivibrionaceae bacterium]PKN21333.1 MAG: nif-specific transcriptional activator NifA [Deltaproteobacteria bacterium HGW-Deltaproteobacteria-3]
MTKPDYPTERLELQALYQISQLIGSALDIKKTLFEVLQILHETLRMERATLVLQEEGGERLSIAASYGLSKEEERRGIYRLGEGIIGRIFQSAYPFVVPDIHSEPLFLNRTGARANLPKGEISFIGVPVMLPEGPVGVLSVDRLFGQEISFEEDIRFLTVVAMLIAQFLRLHKAVSHKQQVLVEENLLLKKELRNRYSQHNIIGQCKRIQDVYNYIDKVAPSRATALLLGESGTGKELVARAIHQASPRAAKPFIKINCAALPENLLESELLGHEKGAFTGAANLKKGRFELADHGTIFLDEVGELPLALQAKLLRVLQEQMFERLGGTQTIAVNVRVIAATNRSLEECVEQGTFRADLFYRLNVVPVVLPPLRDRREDIPLLLDHFLQESNRMNMREARLSSSVVQLLCGYSWPGNVRELQNLIERLVIMADRETIVSRELPSYITAEPETDDPAAPSCRLAPLPSAAERFELPREPLPGNSAPKFLKDMEKEEVEAALRRHGWVQARAARELGLTQRQMGYRIKKYGIVLPDFSSCPWETIKK